MLVPCTRSPSEVADDHRRVHPHVSRRRARVGRGPQRVPNRHVLGNVVRRVAERFRAEQAHAVAHDDVPCPGGTGVRHGSAVAPDVDLHFCLHSIVTRLGRKLPVGLRGHSRTLAQTAFWPCSPKSSGAGISCAPGETLAPAWLRARRRTRLTRSLRTKATHLGLGRNLDWANASPGGSRNRAWRLSLGIFPCILVP